MASAGSSAYVIQSYPELARIGLEKVILLARKRREKQYTSLAKTMRTRQDYAELGSISDFGLATETNEGKEIPLDTVMKGFIKRFKAVMYANGFVISEQASFTDLYNKVKDPGPGLAMSMLHTKEQVVANIYNNAFSTSHLGPDGAPLCGNDDNTASTGHPHAPNVAKGKNRPDVDIALSYFGIEQMITLLRLTKSHRGNVDPRVGPVQLLVHPKNWAYADRIVGTDGISGTNDKDFNWVKSRVTVKVCDYFTSETAWFLKMANDEDHEIYLIERIPLFTKHDYLTRNLLHLFVTGEEYTTGWGDYRGIVGTTGS